MRVAWKDQENQLLTDLTDAQAQRLLKCDAFQYAVCEADERDAIMQNAKEPLYKLYFEKVRSFVCAFRASFEHGLRQLSGILSNPLYFESRLLVY